MYASPEEEASFIYMFVVVGALAQTNDFRIERGQVVFLCWMQTKRLSYLESSKTWTQ